MTIEAKTTTAYECARAIADLDHDATMNPGELFKIAEGVARAFTSTDEETREFIEMVAKYQVTKYDAKKAKKEERPIAKNQDRGRCGDDRRSVGSSVADDSFHLE
jgi:hypothetical protein